MFRAGRQKTIWLRGTAALSVVLTLSLGVRPAFGWSLFGWGRTKEAPAVNPAPPSKPAPPVSPPIEMVRGRVAPTAVRVDAGPSGTPIAANNPWRLFDGDGVVGFIAGAPTRVRAELPAGAVFQGLGAYGASNATLTVFTDEAGTKPMKGLDHVSLAGLPLRWNRFEVSPVAAPGLLIEIDPTPGGQADVRELELWGSVPARAPVAPGSVAEALLSRLPPSAVSVPASPAAGEMSYPKLGPDGATTFRVELTEEAIALSRAFLVYDLEGLPHWSAARRRINGLTISGGVHAHRADGGLQVEEISPSWLRAGTNEVQFLASNPNDPLGYKVKNLRVVVVPAAGDAPAYVPAAAAATSAVRALVDGQRDTSIGAKEIGDGLAVDLRFPTSSQPDSLLIAADAGEKLGTITIDPVVNGKVQPSRRVSARLQELKAGWNRIPLDATPTEADGVRVTMQSDDERPLKGRVAEIRVTGSPRPAGAASSLTVSYPLSGECVDGEVYVVGFVRPDGTGTLAGSKLKIDGAVRSKALGPDGAFSAIVPPPPGALHSAKKWHVDLEADFSNGDVVQRSLDIEGCRAPEVAKAPAGPVEDQGAPYGQWVHPGKAATLSFAGATLEIPAGAVTEDTRITVRPLGDAQVPATDETLTNVTIGAQSYRFGPHGMKFAKPVNLTIPYDRFRFPSGMSEEDLGVFFFDQAVGKWHQIQTVKGSASAHTLTAASTHFTDFIAATIATPDHPTADSFNPNRIKDVKSADPAAGVDLIAPPTPNPDGAAHLSFPIWVPPGRMGMQPQLAVTYNSGAANGQMGIGWDLPISTIEVDTRFGVPLYDPTKETETYTLDGELLTPNTGQTPRGSAPMYFHRRAEGKFDTIIRHGSGPTEKASAYSWEVVDKRGNHNFYGEDFSSRGSIDGSGVYRWHLSRSEDAFGNQVIYKYNKVVQGFHDSAGGILGVTGAPPSVEIYPLQILYTADASGQNPGYRLDFEINGDQISSSLADKTARPDSFSSARGGSISFTGHRLVNIRVFQAGSPVCSKGGTCSGYIRRYNFVYTQGEFGKSLLQQIRVCFADDQFFSDTGSHTPTEFYHHTFTYSTMGDNVQFIYTPTAGFSPTQVWATNDSAKSAGLSDIESDTLNGSLMIGAGPIGCDLFHVVGGGSSSLSIPIPLPSYFPTSNEDKIGRAFVDVNGDGLPDLIDTGGANHNASTVLINSGDANFLIPNAQTFVPGPSSYLPPQNIAGHSSRSSLSFQFGAHELYELARQTHEEVWSSESTDKLLADIDGDGFVDLVTQGGMFMNRAGSGFTDQASWTMPPPQNTLPASISQQIAQTYVRTDPVMEWVAPMTGHVIVSGAAAKIVDSVTSSLEDGVTVSVQAYRSGITGALGGHLSANWSQKLTNVTSCTISSATQPPSSQDAPATSGCGTGRSLFVTAGDRFYFWADSVNQIAFDDLLWSPTVAYQDTCSDSAGQSCQAVQSSLSESYGTSAFTFSEQTDFRLAGKPVPFWTFQSAGTQPRTIRFHNLTPIVKRPTGDDVTLQILRVASGQTIASGQPIALPIAMPLAASSSQTLDYDLQATANPGDRFFFQVSSPTQIDPNMISWSPQVDYLNFCHTGTISNPDQGSPGQQPDPTTLANNLAQNDAAVCGNVVDCSSNMSTTQPCHIDSDSDTAKQQNPISPTLIYQTLAPYYQLHSWTPGTASTNSGGRPAGFVAPSNGQITVTGTYVGSLSNQLLIRSVVPGAQPTERRIDDITPTFQGTGITNTEPPGLGGRTYTVSAGESITFDVFDSVDPPTAASSTAWMVAVNFTGSGGNQSTTFQARNNFKTPPPAGQPASADGGFFHGWNYFEWNADALSSGGVPLSFSDSAVQSAMAAPPSTNTSSQTPPPVRVMKEAPTGIAGGTTNGPSPVPGPLWRGSGFDGYIGAGILKPSRQLNPNLGGSSGGPGLTTAFESSQTDASGTGGGFIFGFSPDTSQSSSQIQLIDMNGDRRPDIVTNGGIYYNQINNAGVPCTSGTSSSQCENGQFVKLSNASFNMVDQFTGSGANLREISGSQITATLGISSAVSLYEGPKSPPSWVSMLPTLGLGYGEQETEVELLDINGDGLPDYVSRNPGGSGLSVQINLGYSLTVPLPFAQPNFSGISQPSSPNSFGGSSPPFANAADLANQVAEGANVNVLQLQDNAMNNIGAGYSYFGGNATASASRTTVDMIDINGDGLPDLVQRQAGDNGSNPMTIWFNTGDGFGIDSGDGPVPSVWTIPPWQLQNGSQLEQSLSVGLGDNDALAFSNSSGLSFSVGGSFYFETGLFGCYGFELGAGAGKSTVGSEMRFEDINGDGAPDQVLKIDGDDNIYVRQNPSAGQQRDGVNLLIGVTNPLGGTTNLQYVRIGNAVDPAHGVDMPSQQLVLQEITESDGMTQIPATQIITFVDYGVTPSQNVQFPNTEPSGFYSRQEREFLGFGTVTLEEGNGTQITRHYDTSSYERRHLLLDETVADFTNGNTPKLFRTTKNTYQSRSVAGSSAVFPALTSKETFFYEGQTNDPTAPLKTRTLTYDYTDLGDVKTFTDPDDDDVKNLVTYSIQYQQVIPDPLGTIATLPRPNLIQAFDSGGNLLRQRGAGYESHGLVNSLSDGLFGGKDPHGNVYTVGGANPTWSFFYDPFGNLQQSNDPTGYQLNYTYDEATNTHIATVTDSFGYKSTRDYDLRFGTLMDTTDVNGQPEHIDHDNLGRETQICVAADVVSGKCAQVPTVGFNYIVANGNGTAVPIPAWATTKRKDIARAAPGTPAILESVVFVDGLDRVRQTKKDASVNGGAARIVGGETVFDQKGRIVEEQFPIAESLSVTDTTFDVFPFGRGAKIYAYDVLDRLRAIETPDDKGTITTVDGPVAQTLINYDAASFNGVQRLRKMTKDPQNKLRVEFLSARGELMGVQEQNRVGTAFPSGALSTLTTTYTYDPLSQLTKVVDAGNNTTTASYDSLGHMVTLSSPDAGRTEWRHYLSGLLADKETANLRANNQLISYVYQLNRLTNIVYPLVTGSKPNPENVTYTYGAVGAANGQAGRIASVTDESGTEVRFYDPLGNVSQTQKTMTTQSTSIPSATYTMKYDFDALGRVLDMTYPDGELLKYTYDAGGKVSGVTGTRNGATTKYVTSIAYNELEQRQSITFGNNVTTSYFYYPDTKRLENVDSSSSSLSPPLVFQKMTYTYDLAGNVTALANNIGIPTPVAPNTVIAPGPNFQSFGYDDLYQLTTASGFYQGCACGCGNSRSYTLTMQYDQQGNIKQKTQSDAIVQPSGQSTPQVATSYSNAYTYGTTSGSRPHAPLTIGTGSLTYDGDGNMLATNGTFGPARTFTWTEEDRLRTEVDSGFTNTYLYDADGNRSHKRRTSIETWYVNPFYVVKGYTSETKHVMVGDSRIASELATVPTYTKPTTAGVGTVFYYHPDHLQSTNFTTGSDGSLLQHDEYIASGEVWFQETKNNAAQNAQPWLFNAKELDETGLYAFGARYYNPKYSVWSSPDPSLPAFVKGEGSGNGAMFPRNLGLYSYSLNNPVNLRDPDGRDWFPENWNPLGAAGQFVQDTAREVSQGISNSASAFGRGLVGRMDAPGSNHRVANTLGILAQDAALIFSGPEAAGEAGAGELTRGGTLEAGELYRYTSEGEANVARVEGKVPNTTRAGDPKEVFLSPDKFESASEAETALQIGKKDPRGAQPSPTHRIRVNPKGLRLTGGGNVEGGTGTEVTTKSQAPVLQIDRLKK